MTTPEARRRREVEAIWLLRITLTLALIFAGYQILVVNPRTDDTQAAIQQTQEAQQRATERVHLLAQGNRVQLAVITRSLCELRDNLQRQINQSSDFLAHPQDYPQFNDPKIIALTQAQVDGTQHTIAALAILDCKGIARIP